MNAVILLGALAVGGWVQPDLNDTQPPLNENLLLPTDVQTQAMLPFRRNLPPSPSLVLTNAIDLYLRGPQPTMPTNTPQTGSGQGTANNNNNRIMPDMPTATGGNQGTRGGYGQTMPGQPAAPNTGLPSSNTQVGTSPGFTPPTPGATTNRQLPPTPQELASMYRVSSGGGMPAGVSTNPFTSPTATPGKAYENQQVLSTQGASPYQRIFTPTAEGTNPYYSYVKPALEQQRLAGQMNSVQSAQRQIRAQLPPPPTPTGAGLVDPRLYQPFQNTQGYFPQATTPYQTGPYGYGPQ